jgi:hypothetical protein
MEILSKLLKMIWKHIFVHNTSTKKLYSFSEGSSYMIGSPHISLKVSSI